MSHRKSQATLMWIALILAIIASSGIAIYSVNQAKVPDIGDIPIKLAASLENAPTLQLVSDRLIQSVIENATKELLKKDLVSESSQCTPYLDHVTLNNLQGSCQKKDYRPDQQFTAIFNSQFLEFKKRKDLPFDYSGIYFQIEMSAKDGQSLLIGKTQSTIKSTILSNEKAKATVSLNPSFVSTIPYNFNSVNNLYQKSQALYELCKNEAEIQKCIDEKKNLLGSTSLELAPFCDSAEQEAFYQFVEYFRSCAFSPDIDCSCKKNKPSQGTYSIKKQERGVLIEATINEKKFQQAFDDIFLENDLENINAHGAILEKSTILTISEPNNLKYDRSCTYLPQETYRFCVKEKTDANAQKYKFALTFDPKVKSNYAIDDIAKDYRVLIDSDCSALALAQQLSEKIALLSSDVVLLSSKQDNKCETPKQASDLAAHIDQENYNLLFLRIEQGDTTALAFGTGDSKSPIVQQNNLLAEELKRTDTFSSKNKATPISDDMIYSSMPSSKIIISKDAIQTAEQQEQFIDSIKAALESYMIKTYEAQMQKMLSDGYVYREPSKEMRFEYIDGSFKAEVFHQKVSFDNGKRSEDLIPRESLITDPNYICPIAKEENINCALLAAVMRTESSYLRKSLGVATDKKAHGLGQQFKGAVLDVLTSLLAHDRILETELKKTYFRNEDMAKYIYEDILTSDDPKNIQRQIRITALYLHKIKFYLEKQKKPTDPKTIIQAYHDGAGGILPNGQSKRILNNEKEAIEYYPKVEAFYKAFDAHFVPVNSQMPIS